MSPILFFNSQILILFNMVSTHVEILEFKILTCFFTKFTHMHNFFQIVVGGLFLMIGGLNINDKPDHKRATLLNDVILLFIFLITSVNVIISGFGLNSSVP